MLIQAGLSVIVLMWLVLRSAKYRPPKVLSTFALFALLSLSNELFALYLSVSDNVFQNIQLVLDLVFISSIVQQILFGGFRWTYSLCSLAIHYVAYYSCHMVLDSILAFEIVPEVSLSFVLALSTTLLTLSLLSRVKKFYLDYRFWLILNSAVYYLIGLIAFVAERVMPGYWLVHLTGFTLAVMLALYSMLLWLRKGSLRTTLDEEFLLPDSIKDRIRFWHVPRTAISTRSANRGFLRRKS